MRKSSSPSLSNCNSDLASKIFGIPLDELQQGGHPDNEVPFIVRHVVDYIEEHGGLEQQGLFQVNGNAETVEWLRQRYDSGEEVDLVKEADVPSAISLLRFFLQELPEPVIPGSLHIHLLQLSQDYNNEDEFGRKLRFLLQQLPPVNYSLLKFLCRFLANVASHHEEIWSANSLAAVFGPDVFHIYTDVEDMKEQEIVSRIMAGLLENYYEFFENEEEDFSSNDLSSITEQVNELSEEEEEDEKLDHVEELPEEGVEKSAGVPEVLQSRMAENTQESDSVIATARVAAAAAAATTNASDGNTKCSKPVAGTTADNEVMQQDFVFEDQKNNESVGILLEPCSDHGDSEDGCPERKEYLLCDTDKLPHLILDSSSKIRDLNANTELEVTEGQSVGVHGEAACIQIAHLDLKNVSDGDKWEASCLITFPLIDFKTMHLQRDGEEPFPAFKSWQEDSESGEAQLSPQAARMTHHPLGEDCPPVLSHRSLDFGQSQRFLHDPEALDFSSKALSFTRIRRSSFSSKDEKREDRTPYQLVKKLQKKIRQFEEQFERERNSKPSYSDIAANPKVLKWMTELTKLRKQIKDAKHKNSDGEFVPQTRPRSNTLPKSFGSSLGHEDSESDGEPRAIQKEKTPSKEATLELITKRLKENRAERHLPEDVKKMTKDHLIEEKTSLQKSLLYYESQHGRPVTREERHIVKPLYDRYRLVKQMLTRASITPVLGSPSTKRRGQMLQPIIEGETAHFFEEIKEEEEDGVSLSSELGDILSTAVHTQSSLENSESDAEEKLARDLCLSSTRAASMPELLEQLWKARAEKKKLRKTLREFEEAFYQQNGRNAQKEDRVPVLEEYKEYKRIKAKLRLLEVLISKQDSSKSI
ncbi:protein FAM13B isoform X1 [Rattus norvegicus]|uniref:Protein FAM13B n=4 Tax=Rattus norvegicus TaxID=10116 RepID=A0A8I5ZRM9_RAT|nr:protein FAM13B isoform X1 [Rattus norvegicus]XP_038952658.1 protein FAM13B isoform X1 [Rattus norvegicus]XP_038952659.1 protein FAM13B isoform X1 [Rattus norvegicus]|eukprot:XP_017456403.1 PREDICTED: protein FAM13B isoform X1 [Rattus norvegicus]